MRAVKIKLGRGGTASDLDLGLTVVARNDLGDSRYGEAVVELLKVEFGCGCHAMVSSIVPLDFIRNHFTERCTR